MDERLGLLWVLMQDPRMWVLAALVLVGIFFLIDDGQKALREDEEGAEEKDGTSSTRRTHH